MVAPKGLEGWGLENEGVHSIKESMFPSRA